MSKIKIGVLIPISLIILTLIGCNLKRDNQNMMTLNDKFGFASILNFNFHVQTEGRWFFGNSGILISGPVPTGIGNPFEGEIKFSDFMLLHEIHDASDLEDIPESTLVASPNPDNSQAIINAINWEMLSSGEDPRKTLSRFGLDYPINVENLVYDFEKIYALLLRRNESRVISITGGFAELYGNTGTRIEYELFYLLEMGEGRKEHIYEILDLLNLTEDEGAVLLRQSGSYDAFVFITNLMQEEGLSFERARRRYEREISSGN